MQTIGLTGGSGAGKSFVASLWREKGARVLDCDALYHSLLKENERLRAAIGKRFPGVLRDEAIDRAALRSVAFGDREALEDLNRLTHGFVAEEARGILEEWRCEDTEMAVVEAICLHESGLGKDCGYTVAICAPMELRLRRLCARDGLPEEDLLARIKAQQVDSYYTALCDAVLYNEGDAEEFRVQAEALYKRLKTAKA